MASSEKWPVKTEKGASLALTYQKHLCVSAFLPLTTHGMVLPTCTEQPRTTLKHRSILQHLNPEYVYLAYLYYCVITENYI